MALPPDQSNPRDQAEPSSQPEQYDKAENADQVTKLERTIYYPLAVGWAFFAVFLWSDWKTRSDLLVTIAATSVMVSYWLLPFFKTIPIRVFRFFLWISLLLFLTWLSQVIPLFAMFFS